MFKEKSGTSIISLALAAVAIALTTTALVVATNNSEMYRAQEIRKNKEVVNVETKAYVKIYNLSEVRVIARQAFANNYLDFYDNNVDLEGFEALVIGEMMQQIPQNQLEDYVITVTQDRVTVAIR